MVLGDYHDDVAVGGIQTNMLHLDTEGSLLELLAKTKPTKLEFRAQSILKFNFHFSRRPLFLFLVG